MQSLATLVFKAGFKLFKLCVRQSLMHCVHSSWWLHCECSTLVRLDGGGGGGGGKVVVVNNLLVAMVHEGINDHLTLIHT